jgi:lysophospholipase L1-like esterase
MPALWLFGKMHLALAGISTELIWSKKWLVGWFLLVAFRIFMGVRFATRGASGAGLWRRKPYPQIMMSLIMLCSFFGGLEVLLELSGFSANLPPVIFEGKDEQGGRVVPDTLPDPELLWKFKPGSMFHGRVINQLGFREREVNPQKAPGTMRIICMGDSITGQGRPGYAQYLNDMLQANPPAPGSWEAFNIGVHGYCVLQGLVLYDRLGPVLKPDFVTIYFGWNDHWLDATPMSQQMAVRVSTREGRIYEVLKRSRLFSYLVVKLNPSKPLMKPDTTDWVYRVPPEQYREGLKELVRKIRASGATPIVLTAPRRGLTKELTGKNYARSIEQAEAAHDQYVEITREVAAAEKAPLLDLAKILEGPENDSLFARDGIHFDYYSKEGYMTEDPPSQPGLQRIARELYTFISALTAP